jgi:hypothetical protein
LQDPKAPAKSYYRPDLHNELKRVALLGLGGKSVKLVLGAKVVSVVSPLVDALDIRVSRLIRERISKMQAPHLPTEGYSKVMY